MTSRPHFLDGLPDRWTDTPCREHPDIFVDACRRVPLKEVVEDARRLCAGCPVRPACLEHAITNGETDGIWGGLTADERADLVRDRATQPTPEDTTA